MVLKWFFKSPCEILTMVHNGIAFIVAQGKWFSLISKLSFYISLIMLVAHVNVVNHGWAGFLGVRAYSKSVTSIIASTVRLSELSCITSSLCSRANLLQSISIEIDHLFQVNSRYPYAAERSHLRLVFAADEGTGDHLLRRRLTT